MQETCNVATFYEMMIVEVCNVNLPVGPPEWPLLGLDVTWR